MENKEMLQAIINKVTDEIVTKITPVIRGEVSDLVESMAAATLELLGGCHGECPGDCTECEENEPEEKEPIKFEIHTHGVDLDDEDRLRLSKLICDFLTKDDPAEEGESEDITDAGDPPEEPEFEESVERVTIVISDDGEATIKKDHKSSSENTPDK